MSLTSELASKVSPVHRFMRERFPNLDAVRNEWTSARATWKDTILPVGEGPPWARIGGAIDYRIRFAFAPTPFSALVASQGARNVVLSVKRGVTISALPLDADIDSWLDGIRAFAEHVDEATADLFARREHTTESDHDALCRLCFVLAILDEAFRSGQIPPDLLELSPQGDLLSLAASIPEPWIADLCALFARFAEGQVDLLSKRAVCNPTFAGSGLIGGADADLIVDGCLIDLKTTKTPHADWQILYQLLGYALLDFDDEYDISALAVYLTRQGSLIRWPLDDFMERLSARSVSIADVRADFRDMLVNHQAARPKEQ